MKLQHEEIATLDSPLAQHHPTENFAPHNASSTNSFGEDSGATIAQMVRDGIAAAKAGNLIDARKLLQEAVYLDKRHETALMWLASISDRPIDLLGYLQEVLHINPANERAASWARSTKAMLAKSLVQQGAASAKEGMPEIAVQYFLQAVEYEPANETAWLWLASVASEPEDKLSYLNRVLQINPAHEKAVALFHRTKSGIARQLLKKGSEAFEADDRATAAEILRDVLEYNPNLEEAWLLKANLSDDLNEKTACLERVLEINRENATAAAELACLAAQSETAPEFAAGETAQIESDSNEAERREFGSPETAANEIAANEIAAREANDVQSLTANEARIVAAETAAAAAEEFVEAPQNDETQFNESLSGDSNRFSEQPEQFSEQSEQFSEQSPDSRNAPGDFVDVSENHPNAAENFLHAAETKAQNAAFDEFVDALPNFTVAEEASAAIDEAAASAAAAPETLVACQFCAHENSGANARCAGCGAFVRLADYERLLNNELNDEAAVREFIERHHAKAHAGEFGANQYFDLGLAFLNLRNARKAVGHFENALRLAVDDEAQSREINDLLDYLRAKSPEIFQRVAAAHGKKILVVDDSPTVRKLIAGKLEKHGHAVVAAVDGMDALAKINESLPDLIFLDVTMPRLDGYQLCKLIKANGKTKHVPVVMISGKDGFFDKVRGRMAGSTAYITKPFGPETLLQTIESYCK